MEYRAMAMRMRRSSAPTPIADDRLEVDRIDIGNYCGVDQYELQLGDGVNEGS
jgi:hypothetical protein